MERETWREVALPGVYVRVFVFEFKQKVGENKVDMSFLHKVDKETFPRTARFFFFFFLFTLFLFFIRWT